MKTCLVCGLEKALEEFPKRKTFKSGYAGWCKNCHKQRTAKWKKENPEKVRDGRLKHKFGISLDTYTEMFNQQNGVCAICRKEETITTNGIPRRLAVDHDKTCCPGERSCGKCVRGLLCQYCNTALGLFKEEAELLNKAINYLKGEK